MDSLRGWWHLVVWGKVDVPFISQVTQSFCRTVEHAFILHSKGTVPLKALPSIFS